VLCLCHGVTKVQDLSSVKSREVVQKVQQATHTHTIAKGHDPLTFASEARTRYDTPPKQNCFASSFLPLSNFSLSASSFTGVCFVFLALHQSCMQQQSACCPSLAATCPHTSNNSYHLHCRTHRHQRMHLSDAELSIGSHLAQLAPPQKHPPHHQVLACTQACNGSLSRQTKATRQRQSGQGAVLLRASRRCRQEQGELV